MKTGRITTSIMTLLILITTAQPASSQTTDDLISIRGLIYGTNEPLKDHTVTIRNNIGDTWTTITDERGYYIIEKLEPSGVPYALAVDMGGEIKYVELDPDAVNIITLPQEEIVTRGAEIWFVYLPFVER